MAAAARDPVLTPYRTLLAFGAVAIVILALGLIEFVHFEPFGTASGVQVHIVGVFRYDAASMQTVGPDRRSFARGDQFAAVVDWTGVPNSLTVTAAWYDSFENIVGSVGPASPSQLGPSSVIPAAVPSGLRYHLPGQYIFAVERLQNGLPVEVLARRIVLVER